MNNRVFHDGGNFNQIAAWLNGRDACQNAPVLTNTERKMGAFFFATCLGREVYFIDKLELGFIVGCNKLPRPTYRAITFT